MGKRTNGEESIYQRKDGRWVAALTLGAGKRKYLAYCYKKCGRIIFPGNSTITLSISVVNDIIGNGEQRVK